MGTDVYNVFHDAVSKCIEKDEDGIFYDLDLFIKNIKEISQHNEYRIRAMAYLILNTLCDEENENELIDEIRYMLMDDNCNSGVCIIKHDNIGFNIRGGLPTNFKLSIEEKQEK